MAPRVPYLIIGKVLDRDGSTAVADATVTVFDTTLDEKISIQTDAAGDFVLDLANLTSAYSADDKLQLLVHTTNQSTWYRHTVDLTPGIWELGSIPLHAGKHHVGRCRLNVYVVANHSGTVGQVDFFDIDSDDLILSVEAAATGSESQYLAMGLLFKGGICLVREVQTAGSFDVALVAGG